MLSLFSDVKNQIKFKKEHPTIETWVFKAMKLSMLTTLLACILVTAKTYIGDNINCVTGFVKQEHKAIETYCFISTTFSMVNLTESDSPYHGVGPVGSATDDDMKRHAYYQWVPMVLAIQTAVLYFPRWVWKNLLDKNKFTSILGDLSVLHIDAEPTKKIEQSARYMASSLNQHMIYAVTFLLCEIATFAISFGNLFFTDWFLGGDFFSYGKGALHYISGDITDMNNPLNEVFPKIAKCTWRKFGPTGSIQSFDAMCVLPLNIVNEKTFIMLWLVYIITCSIIGVVLVLHIALAFAKPVRDKVILRRIKNFETRHKYDQLKGKMDYGSWFLFYHLSKSMVGKYFEDWIELVHMHVTK
uniref:Innexin n=1 Tax=Hirondellea gigas TaxID=1518452 RepID=A0A2P2I2N3_9CRUS